jgi:NADPH:quinone reductase-like Zn-dependent oxidoreductase
MKAAFYTKYGAARDVLTIGELPDPQPGAGAVRVRVRFSGIKPSDCNRSATARAIRSSSRTATARARSTPSARA